MTITLRQPKTGKPPGTLISAEPEKHALGSPQRNATSPLARVQSRTRLACRCSKMTFRLKWVRLAEEELCSLLNWKKLYS